MSDSQAHKIFELMPNTPRSILKKINSWCRNGSQTPLTVVEIKRLLKTNCKVDLNTGCWLWLLGRTVSGYGELPCRVERALNMGTPRVHVVAFTLWKGPIPVGKFACHTCDVKPCFNPKHLWAGTNQENQLDASRKGSFKRAWTSERRALTSRRNAGTGNPMYGRSGSSAPCYGRTGSKHPMYGKHHSVQIRTQISATLKLTFARKRGVA